MVSRLINQRYEILERVGEGSFFQVSKTRDRVLGRIVAIKTLLSDWAEDAAFCSALRTTAATLLDLTHTHIAHVYDVGEEGGAPFLVTEFVRGINLKERIRRIAPFTLSVAVDFAIAIGEALQHAHAQGIVHGDLRSHNVVISPEGSVKVTDFGMTSVAVASPPASQALAERAAPYRAPELAAGGAPTPASDIYSLGVILYEMLTGGLPYAAESADASAERQRAEPPASPRAVNPGVPRSIDGIVMKAIQRRPEDRYRTPADMLNDLKSVRDALRFGKPLSWSPLESAGAPSMTLESPPAGPRPLSPLTDRTILPAPASPEPALAARMSATSFQDDRISPYLKIALGTVVALLVVVTIVGIAVWMAIFTKPPDAKFPNIIGMKLADAQAVAEKANVRLVDHDEFNDKFEPGVIYRTDWQAGRPIGPGRRVNVWVSKGSRMVWVPNLVKLNKDDAEKKIKEAGLILGEVDRQYSNAIPMDSVLTQNPRAGKRVNRDVPINLQISDGPKPGDEPVPSQDAGGTVETPPSQPSGDQTEPDQEPRTFNLKITVRRDGRGERRVRVEYDDAVGTHTPIDENHREGEVAEQRVTVYGRKLVVRVYYGDDPTPAREETINLPRQPQ